MFCRYCGNELPDDAKFCNNCGAATETRRQEPENMPELPQVESSSVKPFDVSYTGKKSSQKAGSKKIAVGVAVAIAVIMLGGFGLRAVNEYFMKQKVPQSIFEDSREKVIAHYDEVMPYPYDHDLGYGYGCLDDTFSFEPGTDSKTFHVTGYLSVKDMTGKLEDYPILVEGTVTTNFFRTDWSAEWDLSYQDPIYETQSYSETSTPAASVNQFRSQFTSYNGEYIQPHIPSESGGFTEGSGHVEVTINLEAASDNTMNADVSVLSFSDSARVAEVSASGEVEIHPSIIIEFEEDGWGNKGILHLLFLENGEIGVWSEITEYDGYANWGLDIEYTELARSTQ